MIRFYASNLQSTDCSVSANLYSELFGLKILKSSQAHSEVRWPNGQTWIFSKESQSCPVSPGTVTLQIKKEQWENLKNRLLSRGFSQEVRDLKYCSVLDPWMNRIWFYFEGSRNANLIL
ncbi:hypothetical protein AB3N59_09145 [Leptospira sp. WS92.C1]